MRLGYGRLHLPVDTTFDGTSTGCNRMVGDNTLHAGDSRIPASDSTIALASIDSYEASSTMNHTRHDRPRCQAEPR